MKANTERLYNDAAFLTALKPARNYRHRTSLDKACTYIEAAFAKAGAAPVVQTWRADGLEYKTSSLPIMKTRPQAGNGCPLRRVWRPARRR